MRFVKVKVMFWVSIALAVISLFFSLLSNIFIIIALFSLGITALLAGLLYTRQEHAKQNYAADLQEGTFDSGPVESELKRIVFKLVGKLLDWFPWWTLKVIFIMFGLVLIGFSIFLIYIY